MLNYLRPLCIASCLSVLCSAAYAGDHGSSVGHAVKKNSKSKIYHVTASDQKGMRFDFSPTLESKPIHKGDTVTFIVKNTGFVDHEFGIDNEQGAKKLSQMMLQNPMMKHAGPNIVSLKPQETKEITWKFSGEESIYFSCTLPGHFAAGMYKTTQLAKH